MQNFNHVAGGFAFTGIFASFAEVNIFERFDTMAVVWVAAILPDVDHTKSIIGTCCHPLAKWIQTHYGHRTITHSLWFLLATVLICKGLDNLFHQKFTLPVALALSSHLIFDMCTKQGIPIFYPFSRRPAVLPANPKLRLSANDFRSEAILFGVFCCLNVFSYPLMAAGFWTKYNHTFDTWEHLERETRHKPGDYQTVFLYDADTIMATLVEQKSNELIVWRKGEGNVFRFERFDLNRCKLIDFRKLASHHEVKTVNLVQVTVDSLNRCLRSPVVKVMVQSAQEVYCFDGPMLRKGNELSVDYPNGARFGQITIDNAPITYELMQLALEYKAEQAQYQAKLAELKHFQQEMQMLSQRTGLSDYEEGKRREKIRELIKRIAEFDQPLPVNDALYQIRKEKLEHQLQKPTQINATMLIWQDQNRPP